MDRRSFLGCVAAGGTAAVAGCSTSSSRDSAGRSATAYPLPSVDVDVDGWMDTGTQSSAVEFSADPLPVSVTAHARTRLYEDVALRREVNRETLGQFDRPLAVFFATRVTTASALDTLLEPMLVANRLAPRIRRQFEERGIQSVERTEPTAPTPAIEGAEQLAFRGVYPTPTIQREITVPNVGTRTLELSSGLLPVDAFATVWTDAQNALLLAGGAYPARNYAKHDTVSISGSGVGDGIDVSVSVTLALRPEQTRRELVALAESVS